jgi:hypothetical protein
VIIIEKVAPSGAIIAHRGISQSKRTLAKDGNGNGIKIGGRSDVGVSLVRGDYSKRGN